MTSPIWHTRRRLLRGLALGAGAAGLAGCAAASNLVGGGNELPPLENQEYHLGAGDQVHVNVFGETALTGDFLVSTRGTIAYPLVGEVEAAGLTASEFARRLQEALGQYLRQPNVSVSVANYRPFFILGEVVRPGSYPYTPSLTVLNAVATAGGFTYRANQGRVFVKHAAETEETGYRLTSTTPVLPGDTIRIGERLF